MSVTRRWAGWGLIALGPLAVLAALLTGLLPDPTFAVPRFHFYIVTLTSVLAIGLAALMAVAAKQLHDARVVFLALAFLGIAGIFLVHALTTPGALIAGQTPWVGFSGYFSLGVGASFLALSAVEWPSATQRAIVARQGQILGLFVALLVAYGMLALGTAARAPVPAASGAEPHAATSAVVTSPAASSDSDGYGYGLPSAAPPLTGRNSLSPSRPPLVFALLAQPALTWAITVVTIALLGLTGVRYLLLYRLTRLPLLGGFLASVIFLAQAQLAIVTTRVWHASWWEYHLLLLAALVAALVGLSVEYAQHGSLRGVIEGLLLRDTIAQLQRGYTDVIVALVAAVEAKDPYTRGHTQRVADLAVRIGQELRLPPERLRTLNQAALLHDIGKIAVPDAILNKPGRLTDEEFAAIQEHPSRGHAIIRNIRSLQRELGGVRWHHERLDGSGYPDGLVGDEIPLEARIIAVADVYDALTSTRSYRASWSPEQALATIDAEAGTRLDPRCVAALHRVLADQLLVTPSREAEVADDQPLVAARQVAGKR